MPSTPSKLTSPHKRKLLETNAPIHVAYKGLPFNFTYNASLCFFQPFNETFQIEQVGKQTLKEVFSSVVDGHCDYAIVPLESSSFGSIYGVLERLLGSNDQLTIIGEIGVIEFLPLCVRDASVAAVDVDEVISHPHILECCGEYLDVLDQKRLALGKAKITRTASWDTSAACETVAQSSGSAQAAICSRQCAAHHNMRILEETIASFKNAETRYVILAKKTAGHIVDPVNIQEVGTPAHRARSASSAKKCTIALVLRNTPGAIFKMSSCFAFRNIDINKIESRPATVSMRLQSHSSNDRPYTQKHWDLVFFIDFVPSDDATVNAALRTNLLEFCLWIKELGVYRSGLQGGQAEAANWSSVKDVLTC